MLNILLTAILSACLNVVANIFIKAYDFNRFTIKERYFKAYLPFFVNFAKLSISDVINNDDIAYKTEVLTNFNNFICDNICYFEPNTQTELYYLIKIGLCSKRLEELNISFYGNEHCIKLLKTFYNNLLKEHCKICKKVKLPTPDLQTIVIK